MKVFVPRNIAKGWFKMNFQIGPLSVSLIQLVILAVGMALALVIWNGMVRGGAGKATAAVFAIPVFIIFVVIAFFNVSEMGLLQFIAKLIRTNMLDTPRKFQDDYERIDPLDIAIRKSKADDKKKSNIRKDNTVDQEKLDKLQEDSIF